MSEPVVPPIVPKVPATSSLSHGLLQRVARSGMWNTIGFLGATGSSFIISIVVARTTDVEGLGQFTYYSWLMRLAGVLLGLGLPAALARFIPESLGANDAGAAKSSWSLAGSLSMFLGFAAFAIMFGVSKTRGENSAFASAVGLGAAFTLFVKACEGFLQGTLMFKQIARTVSVIGVIQIVLIVVGARLGADANVLLVLFALSNVPFAVLLYLPIARQKRRWPKRKADSELRGRILRFAATLSLVALIDEVVWGRPEVFFLEHFHTAREVGLYSAGLKFAGLVVVLPAIISKSLLPEFSAMHGAKRTRELDAAFPQLCIVIAYVAVGLAILGATMADIFVTVIYTEAFRPAVLATQVLLAGSVFGGLAGPVAAALFASSREKFFVQFGLLLVTINLVLDLALIPPFGLLGASIATISSQTIGAGIGYFLTVRRANLPYPTVQVLRLMLMAVGAGILGRVIASLFEGVFALAAGSLTAGSIYVVLANRSRLVTFAQLRSLGQRSSLSAEDN